MYVEGYLVLIVPESCSKSVSWNRRTVQGGTPAEERQRGSVKAALYLTYLRAWGPALVVPVAFLLLSFATEGLSVSPVWSQSLACSSIYYSAAYVVRQSR